MPGRLSRLLGGVALLLLVGLAWLQWHADRTAAPGTLLSLSPRQIDRIEIVHPGQPPQRYRRRGGHWWHAQQRVGKDASLDNVAAIAAAPVMRWLQAPKFDMHKLGLEPPQLILRLNGRQLDYGVMTPLAPDRYVRVGKRIAVIPAQYAPRIGPVRHIMLPGSP